MKPEETRQQLVDAIRMLASADIVDLATGRRQLLKRGLQVDKFNFATNTIDPLLSPDGGFVVYQEDGDYFVVRCKRCGNSIHNEYLGYDPGVPHFRATCTTCGESDTWKLSVAEWTGLPHELN